MEERTMVAIKDYSIIKLFPKALFMKRLKQNKKEINHILKVLGKLDTQNAYQNSAQKETEDFTSIVHVSYDKQVLDKLPKLKKRLLNAFYEYKNEVYSYTKNDFVFTTSWISKATKGKSSFPHNHRNCMFSGVYYPQMDEKSAAIFFEDTTDQRFNLSVSQWNLNNTREVKIDPQSDVVMFFPSELYHIVGTHRSEITRYCIAMNFMPIGELGDADSYVNLQVKK